MSATTIAKMIRISEITTCAVSDLLTDNYSSAIGASPATVVAIVVATAIVLSIDGGDNSR